MSLSFRWMLCFAAGIAAPQFASALSHCVTSAADFQSALTAAQSNNQPNVIQVPTGTFTLTAPLTVSINDGQPLTIEGGYPTGCSSLPSTVPDLSIISGAHAANTSVSFYSAGGGLTIRNMTFTQLKPAPGTSAVYMSSYNTSDPLLIENVAVTNNNVQGINDYIMAVYPAGGLLMRDNLVHDNGNAAATVYVYSNYPGLPLSIVNNTIANNTSAGLWLNFSGTSILPAVFNNILWNNAPDLRLESTTILAMNNTFSTQFFDTNSHLNASSADNSTTNPQLQADYRLGATSTAINSGLPAPMQLPLTDAAENYRVQGSAPDRGAYETPNSDQVYFVVNRGDDKTHTDDTTITCAPSKPCTLREAMNKANLSGPAHIGFHLGSDCSTAHVVEVDSPLPAVTVPLLVDGFSQPGTTPNTVGSSGGPVESNATLCVVILGGHAGAPFVATGFSVADTAPPSASVELRGLIIENFATAVSLAGGNGHWIHANQFYGPYIFGSTIGNTIGVQILGGAATVVGGLIGNDGNFIGLSSGAAGVSIFHNAAILTTVAQNNFGGDPGGTVATRGNSSAAILLDNSAGSLVNNNYIVANGGDGIRVDGAASNMIQSNFIGSSSAAGLGNGGAGVHVLDGAYDNWIGMTDVLGHGGTNFIEKNAGAGVWVDVDAAGFNQVVGNRIADNGGLAIDLASLGPTNNAGNESTGPNDLLHKPFLTSADGDASLPIIHIRGTIATQPNATRFLSVYSNYSCGNANYLLGTVRLQAGASGIITINTTVPSPSFGPAYITATATDNTSGASSTSEISNCKILSAADDIFNDGFNTY